MQVKAGVDQNGTYYEFVFMEDINKILIFKKGVEHVYDIEVKKNRNGLHLICDCFGFRNHKHCKHVDFAEVMFDFDKVVKPRTWINKLNVEYMIEIHNIEKGGFYYE